MNMGMDGLKRGWRRHGSRKGAEGSPVEAAPVPVSRARFGLLGKITIFLVLVLLPVAIASWTIAYRSLQENLTREFTDKGSAIANSLSSSAADLVVNRDASTVQAQVDEFAKISGVAYVMVYDPQRALVAHTFAPVVPKGIIEKNVVPGQASRPQVQELTYLDPRGGSEREIIDIGVPMLGGRLGTVRVGMDKSIIRTAAVGAGNFLLLVLGGIAAVAVLAGVIFAQRITRPVNALVSVAERVGRGDLSQLVPVTSRDEIGQMAVTFNESIVRLRSLVQTETDRDEERRKREDLQQNIITFLDTVVEIGKGDLTRRGEVSWDVLGNVVDAINLMVEEISSVVGDVRQAALRVASGSQDTIRITGELAEAAQAQTRDAVSVTRSVADVTVSVRQVADSADQSAKAARQVLQAASKGEGAVRNSLASMQQIRAEVQTISKKIKSLGDRSLEISNIVNTIQDIAAQTHLLSNTLTSKEQKNIPKNEKTKMYCYQAAASDVGAVRAASRRSPPTFSTPCATPARWATTRCRRRPTGSSSPRVRTSPGPRPRRACATPIGSSTALATPPSRTGWSATCSTSSCARSRTCGSRASTSCR